MAICQHYLKCPFFNNKLKDMPTISKQLQEQFCNDDYSRCARYLVNKMFIEGYAPKDEEAAKEFETAFETLFPNNLDKAERIIAQLVK